jgi:hypothetical protein
VRMAQQRKDFQATTVQQQKTTDALVARLNEQEAIIQKVSAQIEMHNSAWQMLLETDNPAFVWTGNPQVRSLV